MPVFSKLELKNFKCYRDEVYIEWKQFSSIVGLNGVGKSSIVDAIEYVFCFPSYNKKSVESLQICNDQFIEADDRPSTVVKVTLSHEEKEVTFERSIDYYENIQRYLVNEEEVTKKEYKTRLLEHNINSSANNFLIKQNCTEVIATMNAKERCEFFELSCNSINYKSEYNRLKNEMKEALQAVEESQKCLNYFYTQLKNLAKVSKAADKYNKLQENLAKIEFEYYFASLLKIDRGLDETRKHQNKQTMEIRVAEKIKRSYEDKIAEIKSTLENEDGNDKLEVVQQKLRKLLLKEDKLQNILTTYAKKIKKIKINLETTKKYDAAREKTIEDLKHQLAEVKKQKDEVDESESSSSSIQLDDEQYEEYLRIKSECMKYSVQERELINSIERERDNINDKIDDYERKENSLSDQIKREKCNIEKLQTDIDKILKHRESTTLDVEKYSREVYDLEIDIQQSNLQVEKLNQEINDLNVKIGESKYSIEFDRKTKREEEIIDKLKSRFSGVYGRLKNFIEIEQKRYNVAITKILGSKMDHIIVDNVDTAKRCILFLKEQYFGSHFDAYATFIPLDNIRVPDPHYVLKKIQDDSTLQLARSIVWINTRSEECTVDEIQGAVYCALGNVVICENEDTAGNHALQKQIKCVTLDGVLYQKDGVFSGGLANLLKKSRVWNVQDIENLKQQKKIKIDEMKTLYLEIRKKEENKISIQIEISGLQARLKNYEFLLAGLNAKLKTDEVSLAKLEAELTDFKNTKNLKDLKLKLKKLDDDLIETKKKIESIENKYFATFCQKLNINNIQQYEKGDFQKYKQRCERKKQIYDHFDNIKNQLNHEMSRFTELDVKKLEDELNESEIIHHKTEEAKVKLNHRIDEVKKLIETLKVENDEKRKELKIEERQLIAVNNDLSGLHSHVNSADVKITRLKAKKHDILMNCLEKNVNIPVINSSIANVVMSTKAVTNTESENSSDNQSEDDSKIQEKDVEIDYSKLPNSIKKLKGDELNSHIKYLQKKSTDIKDEIELIHINPKVIEETQVIKDKIKVLEDKHQILTKNTADIKRKFEGVKSKRLETFKTFFNSVADNIDRIFKNLYGSEGAQAVIHMTNEEEPYLGGVEFNCMIPEKTFGLMKNLSGGEQTMCAIALLIAIQNVQPTSFLIFDEFDAALHTNNISKLLNFFNLLKSTVQIILISHRYETSAFADAMIGVNLSPQTDTSHVVHIDLTNYLKNIQLDKCLAVVSEKRLVDLTN